MSQTSRAELWQLFSSHFPHFTLQKHSKLVLLWLKKKKKQTLVYGKEGSTGGDVPFWSHVCSLSYTREEMPFFKIHHGTFYWLSLTSYVPSLSAVTEWHELIRSVSQTLLSPVLVLPFVKCWLTYLASLSLGFLKSNNGSVICMFGLPW